MPEFCRISGRGMEAWERGSGEVRGCQRGKTRGDFVVFSAVFQQMGR